MSNYTYLLLSVFIFSGCTSSNNKSYIENNSIKHVILIGSDGFGAYAFNNKANIPNIREMMLKGSYSLKARAVFPTSSAVNWASMIMGSGPELHGFTEWGSKQPELPPRVNGTDSIYPSIISLINEQLPNEKKGVAYTWSGIGYLFEKSLVDLNYNGKSDNDTLDKALEFIVSEKPAFTFIHFDEPVDATRQPGGSPRHPVLACRELLHHHPHLAPEHVKHTERHLCWLRQTEGNNRC